MQEERLLRASEAVFYRFGYRRVTTEQIANEAGVSKRTIYALFPSKLSIVVRSFIRAGREIDACVAAMDLDDPDRFEESLREFLISVANGSGRFSAPLVADLLETDEAVGKRLLKTRTRFLSKHLRAILAKGLEHGAVRQGMNLDATVLVTLMALDCLLHPEARQALRLRAPEPETVVNVLLKGIRTRVA
jgi:AcrR family transcriptional regulator